MYRNMTMCNTLSHFTGNFCILRKLIYYYNFNHFRINRQKPAQKKKLKQKIGSNEPFIYFNKKLLGYNGKKYNNQVERSELFLEGELGRFVRHSVDDFVRVFGDRRFELSRNGNDFSVGVDGVDEPVGGGALVVLDAADGLDASADVHSLCFEPKNEQK